MSSMWSRCLGAGLISATSLAGPAAWAQDGGAPAPSGPPAAKAPQHEVLLGFRGVGEIWQDAAIVQSYRSSRFAGAGFGAFGVNDWLMVEAELGYMRQPSDTGRTVTHTSATYSVAAGSLELIPVTIGLSVNRELDRAEVFAGVGGALAVFTESTDEGSISGVKPGVDLRLGTRIHTSMFEPRIRPGMSTNANKGLDVELMLGRRQHHAFGMGSGFDVSAWRVSVGLVARL